jgi:hypothetical protein
MRDKYLGDTYDLIKRFWSESLRSIAPLYAHHRFVPNKIRSEYTAITLIPIIDAPPHGSFGILFDPHTGIPLPSETPENTTLSHVPLSFLVEVNEEFRPTYMVCFDQSYHRSHKHRLTRKEQQLKKMEFLEGKGIASFYYASHAPFLFAAQKIETLDAIRAHLISLGIPERFFEPSPSSGGHARVSFTTVKLAPTSTATGCGRRELSGRSRTSRVH